MKKISLTILFLVFSGAMVSGFSLEPITRDFSPSGPNAVQTFRLVNRTSDTIAVRVSILTREMNEDGTETNSPAHDDFTIYPARTVLRPNSIQAVRVQWRGNPSPEGELSYRILAEQIPVDFETGQAGSGGNIRILFRYLGALYIVPPGAQHNVNVVSAHLTGEGSPGTDEGSPGKKLSITLRNSGTAHVILGDLSLILKRKSDGSTAAVIGPDQLKGMNGENILAGITRRFEIPVSPGMLPDTFDLKDMEVILEYEAVR